MLFEIGEAATSVDPSGLERKSSISMAHKALLDLTLECSITQW